MEENKLLRTAREIKVDDDGLSDINLNVKIGAAENRNNPETIYIEISFWIKNQSENNDNSYLRKKLRRDLKRIYSEDLYDSLIENTFFFATNKNLYKTNLENSTTYLNLQS